MRRPIRHAPAAVTREYNLAMARTKAMTAPLDKLTDAMIESIVRTHACERDRPALSAELRGVIADRVRREARV